MTTGRHKPLAAVVAGALALVVATTAPAAPPQTMDHKYNANPDAESGATTGWVSNGFATRTYASIPASAFINSPGGSWLFFTSDPSARLTQVVSVADTAPEIDAGTRDISITADIGATGGRDAGATVTAQPLDAGGAPIGSSTQIGPPTARDRYSEAQLLTCHAPIEPPAGTRSFLLTVAATPNTDAEHLALVDNIELAYRQFFTQAGSLRGTEPAEGPGCARYATPPPAEPSPTPTPTPSVSPSQPLRMSRLRLSRRKVSFAISEPSRVSIRIVRRRAGRWRRARAFKVDADAGKTVVGIKRLAAGRYRLTVRSATSRRRLARVQRRFD